jgi:hypothetical protein
MLQVNSFGEKKSSLSRISSGKEAREQGNASMTGFRKNCIKDL